MLWKFKNIFFKALCQRKNRILEALPTINYTRNYRRNGECSFGLYLGGENRGPNRLPLKPERFRLLIQQIHSNWSHEMAIYINIDRYSPPSQKIG